jgi:hypothetical protein
LLAIGVAVVEDLSRLMLAGVNNHNKSVPITYILKTDTFCQPLPQLTPGTPRGNKEIKMQLKQIRLVANSCLALLTFGGRNASS